MRQLKFCFNLCLSALWALPLSIHAQTWTIPQQPLLNKVSYQISAEKWAQTQTAKVTVSLDATLDHKGLEQLSSQMFKNLKEMSDSDWHVIQVQQFQDKSGLETVHIEAQSRLSEKHLSYLRSKAKDISKPGQTYLVSSIEFSPSMEELEKTYAEARNQIYNQINQEISRLNQAYLAQKYFLYSVDFNQLMNSTAVSTNTRMLTAAAPVAMLSSFSGGGVASIAPVSVKSPSTDYAAKNVDTNNNHGTKSIAVDTQLIVNAQVVIASITDSPNTMTSSTNEMKPSK